MEIKTLNILGISEPTLTMIFDNLESNDCFPEIFLLNNIGKSDWINYENPRFKVNHITTINDTYQNGLYFLGVNKPVNKQLIFQTFQQNRMNFATIIHKSSVISSTTTLGKGVHINSLVSIAAHTQLLDFVSVNRNVSIGHHTEIEQFVTINPGANIAGFVKIGSGTLIGMGVNVIDGITIGAHVVIGAGSVVTRNIPDGVVAYGNPCKIIRTNEA